jgi:hypothetical protein
VSDADSDLLIRQTVQQLDGILRSRPEARQEVLELVGKALGGGVTPASWDTLGTSLGNYLGEDPAQLVGWVVSEDQLNRVAKLEADGSAALTGLLRSILGHYGPELETAAAVSNTLADDWRRVDREVLYDNIMDRTTVRMRILKNNGAELLLEAPPTSFASLVTFMMQTLQKLPTPSVLSDEVVREIVSEGQGLLQFVAPRSDASAAPAEGSAVAGNKTGQGTDGSAPPGQ